VFSGSLAARCRGVAGAVICALAFAGVLADQGMAACPNSGLLGFREYLAGCGAFEQVSPAFKVGSVVHTAAIADDGSSYSSKNSACGMTSSSIRWRTSAPSL